MDDLHDSPFFDARTIGFVQKVLFGKNVNPISANEQKISELAHILKDIDHEINGGLVNFLNRYKSFFSVNVLIQFLAGAKKRNLLDEALTILDQAYRDEVGASLQELITILKDSQGMPVAWAVAIQAHEIDDRHKPLPKTNLSQLNLEAMRDFK